MRKRWHVIIDNLRNRPHKIGAEVGVFRGYTTWRVLKALPDIEKYYCIDPWELYSDQARTLRNKSSEKSMLADGTAWKDFVKNVAPWRDKITVIRHMSEEALGHIPDEYLDFVFIDANHSYKYAKFDIPGWTRKVKRGGIVFGHDYEDPHKGARRDLEFGVGRAVRELITNFEVDTNTWYTIKE